MRTLDPPRGAPEERATALDAFATGAAVLVGDPGDPVVFLAAAADRIDAARLEQIQRLARGMTVLGLDEAQVARLGLEPLPPGRLVDCELPSRAGRFRALALDPGTATDTSHAAVLALVHGDPAGREQPLVHVHRACLLGDAFGSLLCDCGAELAAAEDAILEAGAGVIIYVKPGTADPDRRFHCGRAAPLDRAPVLALLSACGVTLAAEPLAGQPSDRWFTRQS